MTDIEAAELIRFMERWGYRLTDLSHPRSPGNNRLIVAIRGTPTEEHYDPEAIDLVLRGADRTPVRTSIHKDGVGSITTKACPGMIELRDRFNVRRAFFTYGASIDVGHSDDMTIADIQSPAPIIALTSSLLDESASEQLVSETEALWAKEHVRWGADDTGFTQCLGAISPEILYASTVQMLWDSYQASRILRQTFPQFCAMLRRESEWLEQSGLSDSAVKPLDQLLIP